MDVLVSTGRVVLKARYSIYPIQLCCVGQTGYVGQTDQDSGVRAEGTLRLHTRWRAVGTLRLHTRWRASSTLLLHTRRRTPHDCVRMGLIGCRVFDTLRQPTRCRAFSTQAIWACSPCSSAVGQTDQDSGAHVGDMLRLHTRWRAYSTQTTSARSPYSSAVGQTDQDYRVRAEGTIRLHTRWRAYSTQAATARVSPARLRPCESPTRLHPYPIRTPSYGVNRMSCLRH